MKCRALYSGANGTVFHDGWTFDVFQRMGGWSVYS